MEVAAILRQNRGLQTVYIEGQSGMATTLVDSLSGLLSLSDMDLSIDHFYSPTTCLEQLMSNCPSLRRLSLGAHSFPDVSDIYLTDDNASVSNQEDSKDSEPIMIQELDLQNFDARFFRLELLKRCPELRHLRLPRRFTDSHAQRLQVLIPVYCRNLEGVHVELEASSMDVLPYLLDVIPVLRYLSVSCRKLNALSYGVVDAVIQTTQYRWLETVIIKNAGSLDTPLGVVVSLLERCTNLKVFVTDIKYLEVTRFTDEVKQLLQQNAATLHTLVLKADPLVPGDNIVIDRIWYLLLDLPALRVVEMNSAIVSDYEGIKFGQVCHKLTRLSLINSKLLERPKSEKEFLHLKTLVLDRTFIPKEDQPPLFELCPAMENFTWRSRSGKLAIFSFLFFLSTGRGESIAGLDLCGSKILDNDFASIIRLLPRLVRLNASNTLFGLEGTRVITEMHSHQMQELVVLQCPRFGPVEAQGVLTACSRLRVFSAPAVNAADMALLRWSCLGLEELDVCIAGVRRLPFPIFPRHVGVYSQLAALTRLRVLRIGEVTDMEEGPFLLDWRMYSGMSVLSTLTRLEVFDCERMQPMMEFVDLQWVVRHWRNLKRLVGSVHLNTEQRDLSNEFLASQLPSLEPFLSREESERAEAAR
ncbi:hypothetical protein BGX29_012254 [Mortierella sp. GBA35]|nr:hypothetical protein BGX29_012254 [Mortierella sp. GBA35]